MAPDRSGLHSDMLLSGSGLTGHEWWRVPRGRCIGDVVPSNVKCIISSTLMTFILTMD